MKKLIKLMLTYIIIAAFFISCESLKTKTPNVELVIDEPTAFEMAILAEVNLARSNPRSYFDNYIAPQESAFSSSYFKSCKTDMYRAGNLASLSYKEGLYKVAKAHVLTQGQTTKTGHNRTNGKSWQQTINGYGTYSYAGENISYGITNARGIVIQLLVDDGVSSLGHRKNMLSTDFDSVGVAYGKHSAYRAMCVMDFAKGWRDK